MKKTMLAVAISYTALMAAIPVQAHKKGEFIVRAGAGMIAANDSSSLITSTATGSIADTGVSIDDDSQLALTAAYMLSDHFAVELLAATPFSHDVAIAGDGLYNALGVAASGTTIATVEQLPPTVSLQYFFLDGASALQPYAGIGINYTLILDEQLSNAAKSDLAASNLDVDDSLGLTVQLGVDYQLSERWLVNAAVWHMDIDTTASFDSAAVGQVSVDLDIDPWVYMLAIGYKF